jgi:hypothetical protein
MKYLEPEKEWLSSSTEIAYPHIVARMKQPKKSRRQRRKEEREFREKIKLVTLPNR